MNLNITKQQVETEMITEIRNSGTFKNFVFSPLSKVYTIIRALRTAIFLFVDTNMISLQKAIHPHSSEPEDLQEHLIRRGMEWKPELPARVSIRIGSTTAPVQDTPIGQGQVITTEGIEENKIRFFLLDSIVLPANVSQDENDMYTITARAECFLPGTVGNVVQDTITQLESPPDGIDYVNNPSSDLLQTGQFRESIASVRARIKNFDSVSSKWEPAWYISEAEAFSYVKRAIFKSSRLLGTEGQVKILILGSSGPLNPTQILELEDHFNSDENDPGGAAHVLVENLNTTEVDKIVYVKFTAADTIPSQSVLDQISEEYFISLLEGQDFVDLNLKTIYQTLPNCVEVEFDPAGNVDVPAGSLATPALTYQVIGMVNV
ncbi:MAG: baseplate J/gp47 family protein [Leptospira sp.]|nr:baseplate J/gp47 family protein [Leptospira sp.]